MMKGRHGDEAGSPLSLSGFIGKIHRDFRTPGMSDFLPARPKSCFYR
jgi:hypothetical protein